MTWAKLHDKYHDDPKVVQAGNAAVGLHARAISYAADYETDGFVPAEWMERVATNGEITALLNNKMLEKVRGGYRVHDYLDYNPSRAQIEERRQAERAKKAGQRAAASPARPKRSRRKGPGAEF